MLVQTTREDRNAGAKSGCNWCSELNKYLTRPDSYCGILTFRFTEGRNNTCTPRGSNLYKISIMSSPGGYFDWSYHFSFLTEQDNPAAQYVTAREIDGDVSPSNTISQTADWLKECARHEECPAQIDVSLPRRVIDVATLRVLHTNEAYGRFAALSYCWGIGSQIQLRSDTFQSLTQRLDFNDLPQTIKDAILVTRSLELAYLWVC
jgi:hypothetical protein